MDGLRHASTHKTIVVVEHLGEMFTCLFGVERVLLLYFGCDFNGMFFIIASTLQRPANFIYDALVCKGAICGNPCGLIRAESVGYVFKYSWTVIIDDVDVNLVYPRFPDIYQGN